MSSKKRSPSPRYIKQLSDPTDPNFIDDLEQIPSTLKIEHSAIFFDHILSLFKKKAVPNDVGNKILLTICRLLTIPEHKRAFISNNFIELLPCENLLLCENILNILDLLIDSKSASKQILSPEFLEPIAMRFPYKTLFLLGKYFQSNSIKSIYSSKRSRRGQTQGNEDSKWVDLLFSVDSFKKPDSAQNYISLLVCFLENNDDFSNDYSEKVWDAICVLLQSQNNNIVKYAYQSLCFLIDNEICSYPVPFDLIASHLSKLALQKSAMSLLFRCDFEGIESTKLISALIIAATTKRRGYIILQRVAETTNGASLLVQNSSWMGMSLPDKLSTVSLFCAVLSHVELRKQLSEKTSDVVNFLITAFSIENDLESQKENQGRKRNQGNEQSSNGYFVISSLCTILRRIPFNTKLIKQMSRSKFLSAYLAQATKQDKTAIYAFHVIKLVADCGYVSDLLNVIGFLVKFIKKNDDNSIFALETSTSLCKYQQCIDRFIEKGINQYLSQLPTHTKYQRRFLQALNVIE